MNGTLLGLSRHKAQSKHDSSISMNGTLLGLVINGTADVNILASQ